MTFIEPFLLWGSLAIAIPVAIHFWHQKRGKPLPWAATQWLTEKNQQQSRGLRLDNILLLLVRCILLLVLVSLLAQPVLNWLKQDEAVQRIHLVQANALITANYRFELDEAAKKGEQVVLSDKNTNPLALQTAIDQLPADHTELHLYLVNDQVLTAVPTITVPYRFRLHTVIDTVRKPRPYLALPNGKRLYVDRSGHLVSATSPDLILQANPTHSGPIRVLLSYRSTAERQTVRAALDALSDVYDLPLTIDEKQSPTESYDWILTDESRHHPEPLRNPKTLYTISGNGLTPTSENVVFMAETLTPQTSERVAGGQLPEWLGEQLIRHYGLIANQLPLSQDALKAQFVPTTKHATSHQATVQHILLLLFIGTLILERWLALTKNA